jgi:hypothetical protein
MSNGSWRIRPSEIERTLRTIRSVGLHIRVIEVCPDGSVKVSVTESDKADDAETPEEVKKLL